MRWQQSYFMHQRVEVLMTISEGKQAWVPGKVAARTAQEITVVTAVPSDRLVIRKKDEIRPVFPSRTS